MSHENRSPVLAVFDFDGTLTNRHTFWRYILFIRGPFVFWGGMLLLLPRILAVLLKITPLMQARRSFIHRFFAGLAISQESLFAQKYVNDELPGYLRPQALRRLRWHQAQGHVTALVSNSPENYLQQWGRSANFDIICGTQLGSDGQKMNGEVVGEDCVGEEKVRRLRQQLPELDNYYIYVYGDSSGDAALLAIANAPFYRNWY
ncbi:HAD-IB family hydrolase [Serratia fonticola]|uniref:HAD-IB family hydrolase n=1 Tax=Serratia fonticola TaxID=47917 RepID=UPI003AAB23E5